MWIVPLGWLYVVLMMAVAEALSTQGTVLGAVFTFLLYGVLPLSIVMYVMGTPHRRRAARAAEARAATDPQSGAMAQGDARSQATGQPVASEGKEP